MAAFDPLEYAFTVAAQAKDAFEKMTKEEKARVLEERRNRSEKEAARARRAEGWRKWRGR